MTMPAVTWVDVLEAAKVSAVPRAEVKEAVKASGAPWSDVNGTMM